jgi:hypothetical protein
MLNREYIKSEIDTLPDSVIGKLQEFIIFQKYSLNLLELDRTAIHDIKSASMSSTSFWDNPDDEVWDYV